MFKYFRIPLAWTLLSFIVACWWQPNLQTFYILFTLSLLEIALSFDNTVVNAQVLAMMAPIWRKRFILYGIPIAVFGMRFIFPMVLVWLTSHETFRGVWHMAFFDHAGYSKLLINSYPIISGFGGSFLLMVAFDFFICHPQPYRWIKVIESNKVCLFLQAHKWVGFIIIISVGLFFSYALKRVDFLFAFTIGMVAQGALSFLNHKMSSRLNGAELVKNGLIGFLYLELLDASFSLDGVVGAFTITNQVVLIMLGLGIGAIFVRSMTILFLEKGVLQQWKFLAHGAHYSILFLSIVMLFKNFFHLSEWLIGSIAIGFIIVSIISSISYAN